MNTGIEAAFVIEGEKLPFTAAADYEGGDVIEAADDRAGVVVSDVDYSVNATGQIYVNGVFDFTKASGVTFTAGQEVWWDRSGNTAINRSSMDTTAADDAEDFYVGIATKAAASGDNYVRTALNAMKVVANAGLIHGLVPEVDCEVDSAAELLLPSAWNKNGVIFYDCFGLVTEAFDGDGEDQGIVTVSDEDDNALGTITAADAEADAVGDIVACTNAAVRAADGAAAKTVAAGKYIDCACTQNTSGTDKAGKFKVHLIVAPLI